MGTLKQFQTDGEVIEILKISRIDGKTFFLPEITLERKQYEAVNKVLLALGAKWNKKEKGHIFDYDIQTELKKVIETGIVTDWKKSTDFFHTPDVVINEMLGQVNNYYGDEIKILEPSAGQGHILDLTKENFYNAKFVVIEKNPRHCEKLREKGYAPIQADFMDIDISEVDIVLMNPPFSCEIEHIMRAYEFLDENGQLIAIASAGILDKNTLNGKRFRQWFENVGGYDYRLPANSFKESGTGVNTKMLVINK